MKVSLITTERNEKDSIGCFLDSVINQSLKADEIIIADGGSTDGTLEVINTYAKKHKNIILINAPGNRSVGRNAAIKAATNEIIACTDVGSRLDKNWLKNIVEPFKKNKDAMVVAGFFKPEPETFFEKVSSTLMLDPNDHIDLKTWLPSSRSIAFKKEAWRKAGGYPEHTNFNEDTPFDLALKAQGYEFEDGLAAVAWWRPRPNTKEFFKQYYYYAIGDGLDGINRNSIIFLTLKYSALIVSIPVLGLLDWRLVLLPIAYIIFRPIKRVLKPWRKVGGARALFLMAFLITTYDLSQVFGFWYGHFNKKKLSNSKKLVR